MIFQDYTVGWGTLALINAGLAQGKRRSGFGWFLLSLLLGPVATFMLVVFASVPDNTLTPNKTPAPPSAPFHDSLENEA